MRETSFASISIICSFRVAEKCVSCSDWTEKMWKHQAFPVPICGNGKALYLGGWCLISETLLYLRGVIHLIRPVPYSWGITVFPIWQAFIKLKHVGWRCWLHANVDFRDLNTCRFKFLKAFIFQYLHQYGIPLSIGYTLDVEISRNTEFQTYWFTRWVGYLILGVWVSLQSTTFIIEIMTKLA